MKLIENLLIIRGDIDRKRLLSEKYFKRNLYLNFLSFYIIIFIVKLRIKGFL